MAAASPWPLIHAEREALIADLGGLSEEEWGAPSLCADWSVHQVLGHMTATAQMTPPRFVGQLARAGFRFTTFTANGVAEFTSARPDDTLDAFRACLDRTTSPPGPTEAMLGEAVVHSEDIRRPLGLRRGYPEESLVRVADFFKGSNLLIGSKNRIDGLRLKADDLDWNHGTGPEVKGPMLSLLMVMTGRKAALADLRGDGVPTLVGRL
ncbi:maleylpyruvate isomerase family mycothiol-dependent enzyme [Streptacidiphilus sp. EB129]|jgi:uncharacterized protein (TIGR03083 family)|uniref:maleylpyruvate isomerase family mycothiol-dependent enzyme n=1 Tax=Streptacidiphilus sp. EB129 TaxID=3156262 RepID=UPI0035165F6E